MKPTISLCIITNKGAEGLEKYFKYFDEVLIQLNGKDKSYKPTVKHPRIELITDYNWEDDFAKARNALLEHVGSEYWSWFDDDDEVDGIERLPELAGVMKKNDIDAVMLPYEYHRNDEGELDAHQYRERLLRTSHPWKWKGAVHETPISPGSPKVLDNNEIIVRHKHKTEDQILASAKRNHKILEREYGRKNKDPRIIQYLAHSHLYFNNIDRSIELFKEYISVSGWDEEKYRAWCAIAAAHLKRNEYELCIAACFAAFNELPDYTEAYWLIAQAYYGLERDDEVVSWLKVGLSKPEPKTWSITSPVKRVIAMVTGAMSLMKLGKPRESYELMSAAIEISPNNVFANQNKPLVDHAYYEDVAIEYIQFLAQFLKTYGGDPEKVLQAIPSNMIGDPRLIPTRQKYLKSQTWNSNSIVFFCAPTGEVWGPDTLDKGMGGSEEAVVYLSRALAKLGYEVTVFNERDEEYDDNGVIYKPWTLLNPADNLNILIIWRAPEYGQTFKARRKYCDVHDALPAERLEAADYIDKFFVKSLYHRSLYPSVKDDRITVISNGIREDQFK